MKVLTEEALKFMEALLPNEMTELLWKPEHCTPTLVNSVKPSTVYSVMECLNGMSSCCPFLLFFLEFSM